MSRPGRHWLPFRLLVLCALAFAPACGTGDGPSAASDAVTVDPLPPPPLDPRLHTLPWFDSAARYHAFADTGADWQGVKFVLTRFRESSGEALFADPSFYQMHDEIGWFRLLAGRAIDGWPLAPVADLGLPTVQAAYQQFAGKQVLPLDLTWLGERLYSPGFYAAGMTSCPPDPAVACPRYLGLGTLLWLPPDPKRPRPEALWLFELEHGEEPTEAVLARFFARLTEVLPAEIATQLAWLPRPAPAQTLLGEQLRQGQGPLATRVVTWGELVAAGTVQGYTTGITAGRLRKVPVGEVPTATLESTDLVLLPGVPDDLPPVAGILTAVPQTPQAHLNLLAAARGTPNAFAAGIGDDPVLDAWAQLHRRVILDVGADRLRWRPLSDAEWNHWLALRQPTPVQLPVADVAALPPWLPLQGGTLAGAFGQVAAVGGKAVGMHALALTPGLHVPPGAVALSVSGYAGHLAPLQQLVQQLLQHELFQEARSRYILLEGLDAFAAVHAGDAQAMKAYAWFKNNLHQGVVAQVLNAGGLRRLIRDRNIDPAWLQPVEAMLQERFSGLATTQALRFRSSSTAEDAEGFNGAGVYASASGFLFPELQKAKKDQTRTVSLAIRDVWASYWSFAAFEERRAAGIPHLDGRMGVLVHPRFDDTAETANGVALLVLAQTPAGPAAQLTVDVQPGSLSVTNPGRGAQALPEIDRVLLLPGQPAALERLQTATRSPDQPVLADAELLTMAEQARAVAMGWLQATQAPLPPAEQPRTVVLDFEFRRVAPGWPATQGPLQPARLVWKQVRPLSRLARVRPEQLPGIAVPRDVLQAAVRATRRTCTTPAFTLRLVEVWTDPAQPALDGKPVIDHAVRPFDAQVEVTFAAKAGVLAGQTDVGNHLEVPVAHPGTVGKAWAAVVAPGAEKATAWGWEKVAIDADQSWTLVAGGKVVKGSGAVCASVEMVGTAGSYLRGLLGE